MKPFLIKTGMAASALLALFLFLSHPSLFAAATVTGGNSYPTSSYSFNDNDIVNAGDLNLITTYLGIRSATDTVSIQGQVYNVSTTINTYAPSGITTVSHGGTGRSTLTANNVLLGNTTSSVAFVAPGTSGNVLTSDGTTWISTTPSVTGASTTPSLNATSTTVTLTSVSTSSFTVPANMYAMKINISGAGGGGAGAGNSGMTGGGHAWLSTASSSPLSTSTLIVLCGGGSGGASNTNGAGAGQGLNGNPDTYGGAAVAANGGNNPGSCFVSSTSTLSTATGTIANGGSGGFAGGGSGGAATTTIPVTPGTVYWYNLGVGGTPGAGNGAGATSTLSVTYYPGISASSHIGSVTMGASTTLPIAINFQTAFSYNPSCLGMASINTYTYSSGTTMNLLLLNAGTTTANMNLSYACF